MLKLTLLVILDAVVGLAAAAVLLAVIVPLLIGHQFIMPGDLAGSVMIGVVLILAIGAMLFRRGSALSRLCRSGPVRRLLDRLSLHRITRLPLDLKAR